MCGGGILAFALGWSRLVAVGLDSFPRSWGSLEQARRLGGAQESLRDASGATGTPQEQPRNEQREFQENRVFRPWEASGGPRGTQNRWGVLAGAKGKAKLIPGYPKEEGF